MLAHIGAFSACQLLVYHSRLDNGIRFPPAEKRH